MKTKEKNQMRAWVEQWKRAGPELEAFRRKELAEFDHAKNWRLIDALLDVGSKSSRKEDESNGMVEMQRIFMKGARRMGKIPSAIREEQAHYGSEIPEDKRKTFRAAMGDQTPAGLYHLGDVHILEQALTAFFCSVRCPGNLILKAYDLAQKWRAENQPVIGGFHSPVEKEVLKIMFRSTVPVCIVLARSLPKRIPTEFRRPLDESRLLLVTPFDAKTERATQETAAYRNQVVAALADRIFVAYAAPGSKTEIFCREIAGMGKKCMTFDDPKTDPLKLAGFASFPL